MKHKKQFYEQLNRVIKWNKDRGMADKPVNRNFESTLFLEEILEGLGNENPKELSKELILKYGQNIDNVKEVDYLDHLLDLLFEILGTLSKMRLSSEQIVDCFEVVINANETKSSEKNKDGKIIKPDNFIGPEILLQKILDRRE